jgi:hypothetical protein
MDADFLKKNRKWRKFFEETEKLSLAETRRIGEELRRMILQIADPEVKEELMEMLDDVRAKAEQNAGAFCSGKGGGIANLFMGEGSFQDRMGSFFSKFKGAEASSASVAGNAGKAAGSMNAAASKMQGTLAIIDAIIKGIYQGIKGLHEIAQYFRDYEEATYGEVSKKTQEFYEYMEVLGEFNEKVYSGYNKMKDGDFFGAITDNIIAWHKIITSGKTRIAQIQREIDASLLQQYLGEVELNRLYRERYDWAKRIGETQLAYIIRAGEELKKQQAEGQKDEEDLMNRLWEEGTYKSKDYLEKKYFGWFWTDIDWLAKDKRVIEWSSLDGMSYGQIEALAEKGLLSEEAMKIFRS